MGALTKFDPLGLGEVSNETRKMTADHNDAPAREELLDALLSAHAAGAARFLIRGATIVSMDRSIGDLARGDILVVDDVIEAIGPDLSEAASDGQAIVVDASDQIAIPGMVDGHRHSWQTQFRRLTPDFDLEDYTELMHVRLAPNYRPHDMYVGNLMAAAAAIDGGITSVLDFSHNSRSPDHCDEAIRAWKESGLRVAFGCCASFVPEPGYGWRDDLKRMRSDHFASEDGLVSLRLAAAPQAFPSIRGDIRFSDDSARFARELGIGISVDAALGTRAADHIVALERAGSLGPDVTLIHCVALHAEAWRAIVSSGTRVVLAVTSGRQPTPVRRHVACADGARPRDPARLEHRCRVLAHHRHVHADARCDEQSADAVRTAHARRRRRARADLDPSRPRVGDDRRCRSERLRQPMRFALTGQAGGHRADRRE